jgi:hypothetical protein
MIKRTPNGIIIVSDDVTIDMGRVKSELKEKFIRKVHDFNASGRQGVPPKLVASVAATHAGLPTGNMAFYTPDRMRQGLPSFTKDFAKPVLLHHNDMKDPVGRVYRATYRDLSHMYVEPMKKFAERYGGYIFTDAKNKIDLDKTFDQVDWVIENMVPMKDYVGLGYGELDLHITDASAAEKIVDQRYLTVSVGFTTDSMYCSTCHQDWASEGLCEHERGKVYDGKKTLLIPGLFNYEEVSWVNSPADAGATVLSISETPSLAGNAETPQSVETVINRQDSMCEPILISVADGKASRLDSFKRVTPERAQEVIDVAKQEDNTQPKAPELVKATIDKIEVDFPIEASDLLSAEDAKRQNYITDEIHGHRHRVIIDPETGNGYTSYDTDHSHTVINKTIESGGTFEFDEELGKSQVKDPHTHELEKKVAPLTDDKDGATETSEGSEAETAPGDDVTVVEDADKKKKNRYKKVDAEAEGEDEVELEDGVDAPEGYELIEDSKDEEDKVDSRKAIEEDESLSDSQKARKLFELSQQEDGDDTPCEFDVVEVELVDPQNKDAKITLAFTSEESFSDSLKEMTPEAIEANRDQLEKACAVFGLELPKIQDEGAFGSPLTKAQAQANAMALFNNINEDFVDKLIEGLNNITQDNVRKDTAAMIVDKLIAETMIDDIYAKYNELAQELKDARERLSKVTKANRDFYAGKQDDLARVVVALKVALKKPEFVDLNEEALAGKTKELKVRSVDSLQDSLNDLINEFSDIQVETEPNEVSETPVEPKVGIVVEKDNANRQDMEIFEGMSDRQYAIATRLQNRFKSRS